MANLSLPLEIIKVLIQVAFYYLLAIYKLFVPNKLKNVRGQVVLITGAGRGIGRELAVQFAAHGASLALLDINESSVEETAVMVKERGAYAYSYTCDVTNKARVSEMATQVKQDLGEVDILINNAGILICKDILSLTETDVRRTFEINTISHFWTIQEFLPSMMARNEGHIVTIASMSARAGTAYVTDYSGSKYAVFGMTDALRAELVVKNKPGINLTTVCPMYVNTNMVTGISDRMGCVNRFGGILDPTYVAERITEGVLRNNYYIYIPADKGSAALIGELLPVKARFVVLNFLDSRFVDKIHEK